MYEAFLLGMNRPNGYTKIRNPKKKRKGKKESVKRSLSFMQQNPTSNYNSRVEIIQIISI